MSVDRGPRWDAAIEVLDRLGATGETTVVRSGLSLLVRRGEVLVRSRPRSDEPVAHREVEIARLLAECLVPHTPLHSPRGQPFVVGSSIVTAWKWIDSVATAEPAAIGRLARALHEATAGGPSHSVARFDPLAAARHAVAHLPRDDAEASAVRLRAHELERPWAAAASSDPSGVAIVHGDLHGDNVVVGIDGPRITDLELAGAGPPAYDVAPAVVAVDRYGADAATLDAFLGAYGYDPRHWEGFATCVSAYELWVTAWAVGVRDRSDALGAEAAVRVAALAEEGGPLWTLR